MFVQRNNEGAIVACFANAQDFAGEEVADDDVGLLAFLTPTVSSVTRFQALAALHLAGLLPQVEALMDDPETDPLARLAWTNAQEFRRQSPTVLGMAAALGLGAEQLDDLFTAAAGIDA